MERNIRVMTFGCGHMGRNVIKFMKERGGFEHVAAIGRTQHLGDDMGELAGIGANGVKLRPFTELAEVLDETHPDIVIMAGGEWPDVVDNLRVCLGKGYSVATLCEEIFYLPCVDDEIRKELDELAKTNNCRFIGLGMQDVNWVNQCVVMSANSHMLKRIVGINTCILDYAGASEFNRVGLNLTAEQFDEFHAADPCPDSPWTWTLYAIANELNLHVTEKENDKAQPLYAPFDYTSPFLAPHEADEFGGTLFAGKTMGARFCTTLHTEEGVDLVGEFLYDWKFDETHVGANIWRYECNDYTWDVVVKEGRYDIGTTTDCINRVPDILNCKKNGYITGKDLTKPIYRFGAINQYVEE